MVLIDKISKQKIQRSALLRKKILDIIHYSKASHIGSSFSIVEMLSSVYSIVDIEKIRNSDHDRNRVILSKGHAAAALYVTLNYFGLMTDKELETYYTNNSLLGGHATHNVPYVEHSTGALGHGLSVAVGICIGLKSKRAESRVYVIVGDGELHEGSNWEALLLAGHLNLNNLCLLIDNNCLSGIGCTSDCCSLETLKIKLEAFGLEAFEVDGHNEEEISSALQKTKLSNKPIAIISHTIKGKGVSFMENNNVWHYRPPGKEEYKKALIEIAGGN
ncbi:putative transketolase N-terminal section [Candidatus Magnetomoraceae bacterium gMMP-1]